MNIYSCLFLIIIICLNKASAQDSDLLMSLIKESKHPVVQRVINAPDTFHAQIIFEQIDRDATGKPSFIRHTLGFDPQLYFYPASTIKMANAILALEKLHDAGLSKDLAFHTDSVRYPQRRVTVDATAPNGIPTIGHYIEMIFAVSDNEASNRLYEFLGQSELNARLHAKGYTRSRITHRLGDARFSMADNTYTNPVYLLDGQDTLFLTGRTKCRYSGSIITRTDNTWKRILG